MVNKTVGSAPPKKSAPDFDTLIALFNARHYTELESQVRVLLVTHPSVPFAWQLLGGALQMQGKDALAAFAKVVALSPNDAHAHFNLGVAFKSAGQFEQATASYRRALALKSDYVEALDNLGSVLQSLGQWDEAVQCYQRVLAIQPNTLNTRRNLNIALQAQKQLNEMNSLIALFNAGDFVEVETQARLLIEQFSNSAVAWKLLGNSLHRQDRTQEALPALLKAVELAPNDAEAHYNWGVTQASLGQFNHAIESYRKAIVIKPDFTDAYNNLGEVLKTIGNYGEAADCYRLALQINPNFAGAFNNFGHLQAGNGEIDRAIACFRKALEINPNFVEAFSNLAGVLTFIGQINSALTNYRKALSLKPDYFDARSGLLFSLNYTTDHPADAYLAEAQHFGEIATSKVTRRFTSWQCTPHPKRLCVGLISGDLKHHPVGYFTESLLTCLDSTRLKLIAYPNQFQEDDLTARIKPRFSAWKSLFSLNDQAAAQLIHADGVHVLLDLSGHTPRNRLPVFAWKPAPVQVTWLGLPTTTGVTEMDYVLGDPVATPPEDASHFTEQIWRLPETYVCLSAPSVALGVNALPALSNGFVTFASFNNLSKMNDATVNLWVRILMAIPSARLLLKANQLHDSSVAAITVQRFTSQGIGADRLTLEPPTPTREDHLATYHRVDIALDPFPYPGVTTSAEALWMGVPVLSKQGDRFMSRTAASIAHNAGLFDWIARDEDDYVAKAIQFASDLPKLSALRNQLREQVKASPLFDAPHFAKHFEQALWGMWERQITKL